jgi:hypothetical protein
MTKHDGARWSTRWMRWAARRKWFLFAQKQEGAEMLAQIEERRDSFFWAIGDRLADQPMNEATTLYAAQRAVRKALRENAE